MAEHEPPRDDECIFCRIAAGEVPCHKLYEDERVLSFLDVGPIARGHTLVIPKGHWATLDELPAETGAAIGRVLPSLSRAVTKAIGAEAWNVLQNNGRAAHQAVGHVHFHIIPKVEGGGLSFGWPAGKLEDGEAKRLVESVRDAL